MRRLEENANRTAKQRAVGCVLALILGLTGSGLTAGADTTRDAMQTIFANFQSLLTLAADEQGFRDRSNRQAVLDALDRLGTQASVVAMHARRDDVMVLADSLDHQTWWARMAYEIEQYDAAEAIIYQATDMCIACHTRLASPEDSPVAEQFLDSSAIRSLPLESRAKLQIATRRFDDSLETLEAHLRAAPADVAGWSDAVTMYLIVAIRVKESQDRARRFFAGLGESAKLATEQRVLIKAWQHSLERQRQAPPTRASLESARRLIARAEASPAGSEEKNVHLIDYVTASALLQAYLDEQAVEGPSTGEAYYWLGLSEDRIRPVDNLSRATLYLERAIRVAPNTPFAERAFALLGENVLRAFDVTTIADLPDEMQQRMVVLEGLAEPGIGR